MKYNKQLFRLLIFFCLICFAQVTHAVENKVKSKIVSNNKRSKGKKLMQRFEIKSPDNKHIVIFLRPVKSFDPEEPYWKKIVIHNKYNNEFEIVEDAPHVVQGGAEAYKPEDVGNRQWSPDGRYLAVWFIDDVGGSPREIQTINFLDICTGTWEDFEGSNKTVTTDNYTGWKNGQPHTMLLIGTPPKWEDYIEALPVNKPDPDGCK
jgi:hypothetical protein